MKSISTIHQKRHQLSIRSNKPTEDYFDLYQEYFQSTKKTNFKPPKNKFIMKLISHLNIAQNKQNRTIKSLAMHEKNQ